MTPKTKKTSLKTEYTPKIEVAKVEPVKSTPKPVPELPNTEKVLLYVKAHGEEHINLPEASKELNMATIEFRQAWDRLFDFGKVKLPHP